MQATVSARDLVGFGMVDAEAGGVDHGPAAVIATPIAWWLANTRARIRPAIEALTALPLVLPPTVLGFYMLILMSPESTLGGAWVRLTGEALTFSFSGLVIASLFYSLPFAVQPLQGAFLGVGRGMMEAAETLGASRWDAFRSVALPLSRRGMLTAAVLTFAHTVGEFGVVLMVGGNIPGRTRVISIEIYSAVETLDYRMAGHVANAQAVAEWLDADQRISWVKYAGLPDSPHHEMSQRYLPNGPGAVFTFGLTGGRDAGTRFIESLEMISHLANIGDAKTLILHPASTTHSQLSDEQLQAGGVTPEMVRISVGLEDLDDILYDLDTALGDTALGNTALGDTALGAGDA